MKIAQADFVFYHRGQRAHQFFFLLRHCGYPHVISLPGFFFFAGFAKLEAQ